MDRQTGSMNAVAAVILLVLVTMPWSHGATFAAFNRCFTGPGVEADPCCLCGFSITRGEETVIVGSFDFDGDLDIDMHDFAELQILLGTNPGDGVGVYVQRGTE